MEAVEMAFRAGGHRACAAALGHLLQGKPPSDREISCPCGQHAHYKEMRPKQVLTVVGPIEFARPYYVCPGCQKGQSPKDIELDIEGTGFSPGVRRMIAVVGSDSSFQHGREQLEVLAGLEVTTKTVERQAEAIGADIAAIEQAEMQRALQLDLPIIIGPAVEVMYIEPDGTQLMMVKNETEGRAGRAEGESARTREVKLGCVFTQTGVDKEGRPVRDEDSTTYVGAIETAEEFGRRIYVEAWKRGWSRAKKKVVIGDGAVWIWNLADRYLPGAIQIVDLYHARQHIWELAAKLFPAHDRKRRRWGKRLQDKLDNGKIECLVAALRTYSSPDPKLAEALRIEADYFERNAARMRYPAFRKQNLFVGSGVIEAGCKSVIGSRLKQSGMFWTVRGANAIIALRCNRMSGKFENYWESRLGAKAA
jgi:Uncharacterised protein family (UPF0236)